MLFRSANDDLEKKPLGENSLDADAKAAKAKLAAALAQFAGPRPEHFVKQYQQFGGEGGGAKINQRKNAN